MIPVPVIFLGTIALCALGRTADAASLSGRDAGTSELTRTEKSPEQARYIRDVEGKTVRLVGRRFYTNLAKALDFPGRDESNLTER
jgi:hypothetical protein